MRRTVTDPLTSWLTARPGTPRGRERIWIADELLAMWSAAEVEAVDAYRVWRETRTGYAYATYVAAADRASAAQDTLAGFAATFNSAAA